MSGAGGFLSLTDQQSRALHVPGSSVALSAGAGCGKTMVLTERFLAALDEDGGRPLRALVALTFTEKAARELRQRIRARCRAKLAAGDDTARWWAVLRGLDAAPIGTFHEFCARLLRRHALQVGIDPEFAILDESIAGSLREEAVRAALRRLLAARDSDLIDLGTDYGLRQIRDALGRLASSRGPVDLEEWSRLSPEVIVARWRGLVADRLWPAVRDRAWPSVRHCIETIESLDSDHAKIRERRDALLEALTLLRPGEPPCSAQQLDALVELLRVSDLPRKGSWPSEKVYEAVRDAIAALRDEIKKHIAPALVWDEASVLAASAQSLRFARLALAVRREHEQLKRRRRGLDFDDLMVTARDLLRDHPEVVLPVENSASAPAIEFVLVDEFQDTDGIQAEILRLLSGSEFLTGRLFVVGDVKQSIYRFRGAEPSIFRQWQSEFPERGRLRLTENFRSVPGVIHFVNALFDDCFGDVEAGDHAGDADGHRLLPIRPEDTCQPTVEFLWPASDEPGDDGESKPKRSAHDRRMIEARCLARRMRERLDAGWPVFDRATNRIRPAHPGDLALLFRAMTDLWPYESALADEGFDYHTVGGSAFYAQQEVHDVINLLSVVEDPFDEIAMAGALRSPFFGVSDEGLFWLATTFEDGGLTAGLYRLDEISGLSSRDRHRAARALELLSRWRSAKDHMPMARLVAQVLDESGFEAAVVCEFLGERKVANTRKIVRLARDFDRQGGFTLAEFVARLRTDLENEPREEQAATTDESGASIRLMSIHQAKGLEFPIVVLPDLARTSSNRSPLVACHPDLGLVVRPPQPSPNPGTSLGESPGDSASGSFAWQAYLMLERADDEQESLRLFYVAATRARDALILSAGLGPDEPVKSTSVAMRLLDERFDRRSGLYRLAARETGELPAVHVSTMTPPVSRGERTATSARASIATIEEAITLATPAGSDDPVRPVPVPRYLDLDPAAGLSPRAGRLDRLIRAILCDPRWLRGEPIEPIATRAAARQVPAANPSLVREAVRRIDPLWDTAAFRALRAAETGSVRNEFAFTIPYSPDGLPTPSTVFHGSCDMLFRDREGQWQVIVVADVAACRARQQLRLQLTVLAARASAFVPIRQGWIVWHGPDGMTTGEAVTIFDDSEIGRGLGDLIRSDK
jgi:ATP-dependent helicase/nuclease subunit A